LKKLSELQEKGTRLVMTAGNHDFWFKDFLKNEIGMEIYPKSFIEELDGNKIFVNHGDWFTANDWRYKLFRSLIRNKLVMKFFELLHPDIALGIGKMLSRSSRDRKMPPTLKRRKEEGLVKFAQKALEKYDIVVLGHSHSPKLEKFENGIYVNSGDWIEHNSYIKITDGKLELLEYKTKEK
jgi:UDP-2,3-diacylglucosamine hydrolase